MRIAKTDTSFIDGEGIAFVIYFQGCNFDCPGCHNKELQDFGGGYEVNPDDIQIDEAFYDSVVFLGGEPLEQAESVKQLSSRIKLKKWLYTGYDINKVPSDIKDIVDVIVAGRYMQELATGGFPASSNQVVWRAQNEDDA